MTEQEKRFKNAQKQKHFRERVNQKMENDPVFAEEVRAKRREYQRSYLRKINILVAMAKGMM